MCFNVRLGVEDVANKVKDTEVNVNDLKTFSILLSDTVIVGEPEQTPFSGFSSSNRVVTNFSTEWSNVSFDLDDESDDATNESAVIQSIAESGRRVTRGMIRQEQLRSEQREMEESALTLRNKHQRKLLLELQARHLGSVRNEETNEKKKVEVEDIQAFPSPAQYPPEMRRDQIYVDTENEVLFLPIHGVPVPFSVHTVRTVSMTEEGGYGYFRINFHTPQNKSGKDMNATMLKAIEKFPAATYIRNLTFRSRDVTNMNVQVKRIKNVMKQRRQKDKYNEEAADIIEQDQLQLQTHARVPSLTGIDMRPAYGKTKGRLEAHVNGFRYLTQRNETLDIVLSEYRIYCASHGILFTAFADGAALRGMGVADICSLFGNIMENAVEACERMQDPARRVISLNVRSLAGQVSVCAENYFEGEVRFADGLPVTRKEDTFRHGYGVKSIRMIAEKYGGTMQCGAAGGLFSVRVLFPAPAEKKGAAQG